MNLPIVRLSACPCGFTFLRDEIKIGHIYNVHLDTIRANFDLTCGGCGTLYRGIIVVDVDQTDGPPAPLPFSLFSSRDNEIRNKRVGNY